jgi:hypothetical protein
MTSYLSPKCEGRYIAEKDYYGVFALEPIQKGELLTVWSGETVTGAEFDTLPLIVRKRSIQIEEDIFFLPLLDDDPADYFNHCCDPNAGLSGQIALVAMRDIEAGEEICFDYATSDSTDYDEFECLCGAKNCRGFIRGDDWMLPELQARYAGYFSPYLQRRIENLVPVPVDARDMQS